MNWLTTIQTTYVEIIGMMHITLGVFMRKKVNGVQSDGKTRPLLSPGLIE